MKLSLREGYPVQLEQMLQNDEIDLAFSLIDKKMPAGLQSLTLLEVPLVLLVEKNSGIKSAEELWKRDKIDETLICLPQGEVVCKNFQKRLAELGVDWFPGIEASSIELIEAYVASGLGIGVSLAIPRKNLSAKVRALPLAGFPPIIIGALWRGRKTLLIDIFLAEAQKRAKLLV
jgi:DNA-binding transcriptional LysR family regulator